MTSIIDQTVGLCIHLINGPHYDVYDRPNWYIPLSSLYLRKCKFNHYNRIIGFLLIIFILLFKWLLSIFGWSFIRHVRNGTTTFRSTTTLTPIKVLNHHRTIITCQRHLRIFHKLLTSNQLHHQYRSNTISFDKLSRGSMNIWNFLYS